MALITLANVSHSYGSRPILSGATLSVDPGEKIGLVGRNGTGKTTLLKAMLGSLKPDAGSVQLARGAKIGYLSQDPDLDPGDTVRDAAEGAFAELHRLHQDLHAVFDDMASAEGDDLDRLLRKQARIESEIEAAGGYAVDHRIDATLHGLGFPDVLFGQRVGSLSGGQKGRLGLARLLLEAPDLLLLDEPTNHLDIAGREWLEQFLREEFTGAVVLVSHDRWLLDLVVSRIVEIEQGGLRSYPGNYHKYRELREERILTESRIYEKQLDRIRQEEQFIARYKAGQRAKQARGRQTRLERYKRDELVERPIELDVIDFHLPKIERSGDLVVVAEGLSKSFDENVLFRGLDLVIRRGERIGIVGPNGAGKTTLVRCLLGDLEPTEGTVRLGSRLNIGYYRQLHERIDRTLTVWQYLQSQIVGPDGQAKASEQHARDLAGAFLFSGFEQEKSLGDLSGGERSRAVLAGLIGSAHNMLVLDEPTNHLDIPSAERLEAALASDGGYKGTLLVITHDRAFLDSTCERLLIFEGGIVHDFLGNWSDWQAKRAAEASERPADERPRVKGSATHSAASERRAPAPADGVESLSLSRLEERIEAFESRKREIDRLLLDPEVYTDGDRCRGLQRERKEIDRSLEPLEFEWSRRAEAD